MNRRKFLKGAGVAAAAAAVPFGAIAFGKTESGEEAVCVPIVITRTEFEEAIKRGSAGLPYLLRTKRISPFRLSQAIMEKGWYDDGAVLKANAERLAEEQRADYEALMRWRYGTHAL